MTVASLIEILQAADPDKRVIVEVEYCTDAGTWLTGERNVVVRDMPYGLVLQGIPSFEAVT